MFALPSPAIHHDGGKSSHDPTESILVASAADEWRDIASALFDREIEVVIIDWRYALRLSVSRVVLVTALRIIDLTKSRSTACSRLKPTFLLGFR